MTERQTIDPSAPPVDDGDEDNYGGFLLPPVRVIPGLRRKGPRAVDPEAPVRTRAEHACGFDDGGAWLECTVQLENGDVVTRYWRGPGSAMHATWPPS